MLVKYTGPGNQLFPDLHWQPEPGEQREFPDDLADLVPDDHPHLRRVGAATKAKKPRKTRARPRPISTNSAGKPGAKEE